MLYGTNSAEVQYRKKVRVSSSVQQEPETVGEKHKLAAPADDSANVSKCQLFKNGNDVSTLESCGSTTGMDSVKVESKQSDDEIGEATVSKQTESK